jgi:2,4-dienoyl-CoA reductase-like NADH-dependent reductase (Old Yellow Enzyme family)
MWRPPERIRWQPDPDIWPGADEAAGARLFQPVGIGSIALEARTWVPAMVPWRATGDGMVTDNVLDWYGRFARGRPGAIVVEATGIRDIPSGPLLRIGDDRFIPGLTKIAETVRRESDGHTKLFIQLIDFLAVRRRPYPAKYFERFLQITDQHRDALNAADWPEDQLRVHLAGLPEDELTDVLTSRELESLHQGYRERVTDTDLPQIAELPAVLPDLFADAARRGREAGFDGVELHYAHAYTMASFLSALNTRGDGYGGSRENRARLPLEVYDTVRAAVGDDFVVGTRFLSEDCIDGGNTVEDAAYFGAAFARAGFDVLSLSRGGKFEDAKRPAVGQAAYPYTGPSGYECMPQFISDARGPFGRNIAPVTAIRDAVRKAGSDTPVVLTGGIHGFRQAEDILQSNQADIIGFARQSLADPDWFRKVRSGHGDAVRVCEYTNYCEALDQKHVPVTCQLWDRKGLNEPGIAKTQDGKRRMTAPEWDPDKS